MVVVAESELDPAVLGALGRGPTLGRRQLMRSLLERGPAPLTPDERRDRDRAAHLLLYLDDPATVLDLGLDHLVAELGTARGDAGILTGCATTYRPVSVIADEPEAVERIATSPLPNQHPVLQAAWRSPTPVGFERVSGNPHLGSLADTFTELGASAMLATRLEVDGVAFGLLCVDEIEGRRRWSDTASHRLSTFAGRWLSPILLASLVGRVRRASLTAAERDAVALLAEGYSYAEIARRLGKSARTVDNQLRSARRKTGARNAIELVQLTEPDRAPLSSR